MEQEREERRRVEERRRAEEKRRRKEKGSVASPAGYR